MSNPDQSVREQRLHLFLIARDTSKYDPAIYVGLVDSLSSSQKAVDTARLMNWANWESRVYDADHISWDEAIDDMKRRYNINPLNEEFYPLVYEDNPIGELQQIFGIRPEYTPHDIPFDALIKWRDQAINQISAERETAARIDEITRAKKVWYHPDPYWDERLAALRQPTGEDGR